MQNAKNVKNGDKFEKFELLKERFKSYREKMLKIGFENLVRSNPNIGNGCLNAGQSAATSDPHNCPCSFCSYCIQQQSILIEISNLNNLERDIKEIRDYLRDTRKKLEQKEYKAKLTSEWRLIALVLDRTFFYIFMVITFVALYAMFPDEASVTRKLRNSNLFNNGTM